MDKLNFFLIFFIILLSFEFLSIMAYVAANQLFNFHAPANDFKTLMMEIILFAFIAYYFSVKKKK